MNMAFKCRTIKNAVAAEFGITPHEMDSRNRTARVARARMTAAYLCRTTIVPELSLPNIGRQFGRDHSTIIHACRRVAELSASDPKFAALVERCRSNVTNGPTAETMLRQGWHGEARL